MKSSMIALDYLYIYINIIKNLNEDNNPMKEQKIAEKINGFPIQRESLSFGGGL